MQTDDEHIPKGAITLQRLSRSFETTDDISDTHRRSTDWAIDAADEPRQTSHSTMETELTTKPAAVLDRKDYSDLEVVVDIPQTWHSNDKMPVLFDSSEKIASVDNNALLSPSLADPVPAYPASLHSRTSTLANTPLTKGGDYTEVAHQDAESTRSAGKKTWGMSNKQLSWVATGLLGFILMLLATVLAITLSMDKGKSAQGTAAGVVNGDGLLNTSSLAAINWTDSTGLDRSMVFYQSSGNSILVSIRDSASNEWAQTNITEAVMKSTGAKRLDVLHNTPLAAVTNSWQVSLYYLTTSNSISEIWSSDVAGGVWYAGSLATDLGPVAGNGSRLAAYWQGCTNCTNSLLVLHQQTDGNLMLANFTNNSWELSGPLTSSASQVVNETGLAIRPFTETNNTLGMEPSGWKAFGFQSTGIVALEFGESTNYTWESEPATDTLSTSVTSNPSPDMVAITYGNQGWTNSLVTYLTSDGSLTSYIQNGTTWTSGQPSIERDDSSTGNLSFTAIAASQNMKMYAIANGTIYEFEIEEDEPLDWEMHSTVYSS